MIQTLASMMRNVTYQQTDLSARASVDTLVADVNVSMQLCMVWPTLTVSLDYPFLFVIWTFVELQGAVVIVIVW